jgi:hypothetical protein
MHLLCMSVDVGSVRLAWLVVKQGGYCSAKARYPFFPLVNCRVY